MGKVKRKIIVKVKKPRRAYRASPSRVTLREIIRRDVLDTMRTRGIPLMNNRRVGLSFKAWQVEVLSEIALAEGLPHIATLITRDILKLYPTLRRQPVPDARQMNLLKGVMDGKESRKSRDRAVKRASTPAPASVPRNS